MIFTNVEIHICSRQSRYYTQGVRFHWNQFRSSRSEKTKHNCIILCQRSRMQAVAQPTHYHEITIWQLLKDFRTSMCLVSHTYLQLYFDFNIQIQTNEFAQIPNFAYKLHTFSNLLFFTFESTWSVSNFVFLSRCIWTCSKC